ncbi:hypothetical protein Taro_011238, partial [Colocasia esculenta]|nr:hypothetical protein [Colocasia esculenta]
MTRYFCLQIASHPNIYVLDTPGILLGEIDDAEAAAKVALTGAIKDCLVGEDVVARYFLSILNSNGKYKCSLCVKVDDVEPSWQSKETVSGQRRRLCPSDHTQDFIVRDVRQMLFETISSFEGNLENEIEMSRLIEFEFAALHVALRVASSEEAAADQDRHRSTIAKKLLNLFRTGRLGRHTLDVMFCSD